MSYENVILKLLKYAITNEIPEIDLEGIDYDILLHFCISHKIENIIYYALKMTDVNEDLYKNFEIYHNKAVMVDTIQQCYLEQICADFENNQISYLPMKGSVLKNIYPMTDMRQSGDLDIYFKNEDSIKVKQYMLDNGFEVLEFGEHHIHDKYYIPNQILIEMHRSLMSDKYFEWGNLCREIEQSIVLQEGYKYKYKMTDECYYMYMIAHMAKHMKYGGIGIRFILDIWVYLRAYQHKLDWQYINEKLSEGHLLKFEVLSRKLSRIWFEDELHDDVTRELSDYIITGTVFGTHHRYVTSDYANTYGDEKYTLWNKIKRYYSATFLPFNVMKGKYPILKKATFLLPMCWLHRVLKTIIWNKERAKQISTYYDNIDMNEVRLMKEFKNKIGL